MSTPKCCRTRPKTS
ncbi:unnamed protein product [Oikopleura dioica]|uniref:Uncharacterized protein n=1 Tax=Oikopleura dioica TaxID=34765 RepID=E4XE62_OIKDI|nr:unnamed protein product [Oikopleura dioica]CBY19456.1 unnamed protein product [Oikopleura dioica]